MFSKNVNHLHRGVLGKILNEAVCFLQTFYHWTSESSFATEMFFKSELSVSFDGSDEPIKATTLQLRTDSTCFG
jgi:hypothetical protein